MWKHRTSIACLCPVVLVRLYELYANFVSRAQEKMAGDEVGLGLFLDEVRLKARDHARSPVQVSTSCYPGMVSIAAITNSEQWNSRDHGGFTSHTPWMRVNEDYAQCNAEQQVADPNSIFSYWRSVLELRKNYQDVFIYGQFELVDRENPAVFCYQCIGGTVTATIVANFTEEDQAWVVPPEVIIPLRNGTVVLANYGILGELQDRTLSLKPFEAFVLLG